MPSCKIKDTANSFYAGRKGLMVDQEYGHTRKYPRYHRIKYIRVVFTCGVMKDRPLWFDVSEVEWWSDQGQAGW